VHGDLHHGAEFLDLFGQALHLMFTAVSAADPIGTEILIVSITTDDVPAGDQNVAADRADRFESAPAAADGGTPRAWMGDLDPAAGTPARCR
jgi:hypothetical protein